MKLMQQSKYKPYCWFMSPSELYSTIDLYEQEVVSCEMFIDGILEDEDLPIPEREKEAQRYFFQLNSASKILKKLKKMAEFE